MRISKRQTGFSLLELMIAMFVLIILLSVAWPTYQTSIKRARETVLRENLRTLRKCIDQYSADKGKLPQELNDLVTSGYLREIPQDPILEKAEWEPIMGADVNLPDGGEGLKDVKSLAEGTDTDGIAFKEY